MILVPPNTLPLIDDPSMNQRNADLFTINSRGKFYMKRSTKKIRKNSDTQIFVLVFLGSVRFGSSSIEPWTRTEPEHAHITVFWTRTEPELIIPELEPNLNLSMGSVRVRFKVHEQVRVQSRDCARFCVHAIITITIK